MVPQLSRRKESPLDPFLGKGTNKSNDRFKSKDTNIPNLSSNVQLTLNPGNGRNFQGTKGTEYRGGGRNIGRGRPTEEKGQCRMELVTTLSESGRFLCILINPGVFLGPGPKI